MPLVAERECESCGRSLGERHIATTPRPDMDTLGEWVMDDVCEATDGCTVEPDGTCPHGHVSWLLRLGLV